MSHPPFNENERATSKPVRIPTVLAIGCSDVLLSRCWDALAGMGVMVRDCDPDRAATLVASRQPLVMVVPSEVFASDPDEFNALARDVRASLLKVDEDVSPRELDAMLSVAISATLRRREGRSSSERCSILPGERVEAPFGARSEPPPTSAVRPALVLDELDEFGDELLTALR
jgi:hypothetical protein